MTARQVDGSRVEKDGEKDGKKGAFCICWLCRRGGWATVIGVLAEPILRVSPRSFALPTNINMTIPRFIHTILSSYEEWFYILYEAS